MYHLSIHYKKKKKTKKKKGNDKEEKKVDLFIFTTRKKIEDHSFIHIEEEKRAKINGKYWKLFQLRPAPLLLIINSVHIFPSVY